MDQQTRNYKVHFILCINNLKKIQIRLENWLSFKSAERLTKQTICQLSFESIFYLSPFWIFLRGAFHRFNYIACCLINVSKHFSLRCKLIFFLLKSKDNIFFPLRLWVLVSKKRFNWIHRWLLQFVQEFNGISFSSKRDKHRCMST